MSRRKISVVLFNLGGPDGQESVRPFLRNLFSDPAIIGLPFGLRHLLAEIISRSRNKEASANYQLMGGGSPIMPETIAQRDALLSALQAADPETEWQVEIAMRYWRPRAKRALQNVKAFAPDEVVLLPLYPQFSTTTTGSSFQEWDNLAGKNPPWKTRRVISYETAEGLICANLASILDVFEKADKSLSWRLLFSAHGLPEKIIAAGDPYQNQIEQTAAAIAAHLPEALSDWVVCYQSRVGPLKWIGPSTEDEIERAARDNKAVLILPIAFVSEHVETLVELDIEYREVAEEHNIAGYLRANTVQARAEFIAELAKLVTEQTG